MVEKAMERPTDVESLDLHKYNEHLMEKENKPNLMSTLLDIQFEFLQPYGDLRPEVGPPKVQSPVLGCLY
jgi:hypothetical protein